jgi:radical SAM superfamily enzyme YgiQ (UPF0313 family)
MESVESMEATEPTATGVEEPEDMGLDGPAVDEVAIEPLPDVRRVVLVNPPSAQGTTANREGAGGLGVETPGTGGFAYPPQTLATVAASLREAGHQVTALDAVVEQLSSGEALTWLSGLVDGAPVGLVVSTATLRTDMRFVGALAQAMPDTSLFLFGAGTQYVWRQALQESAAALVVLGEPAARAPAVVAALTSGDASTVALLDGVAYTDGVETVYRPIVEDAVDLAALPYPAWDLLPYDRYPFLTLSGSRGCDHGCAYCPYVAAQGCYRPRSPESVAAEARWLQRNFGKPRLVFRDPAFASNRDRTVELCQALRKARVRVPWECESRPEHLDPDLLYRMRRSGCRVVKLGLETVDDTLLWGVNRLLPGWTAARYRAHVADLVATCRRLGLSCRVFVMTGLPGETQPALETTLAFLRAVRPPAVSVKRYRPYPGTQLGEEAGVVVGYPPLPETELRRLEDAMRASADPLPPPRLSVLRRVVRALRRG